MWEKQPHKKVKITCSVSTSLKFDLRLLNSRSYCNVQAINKNFNLKYDDGRETCNTFQFTSHRSGTQVRKINQYCKLNFRMLQTTQLIKSNRLCFSLQLPVQLETCLKNRRHLLLLSPMVSHLLEQSVCRADLERTFRSVNVVNWSEPLV